MNRKIPTGTHGGDATCEVEGGVMARKPTAEEIKKMRRAYGLWAERDKRISKIAFDAHLKRSEDFRSERTRITMA